MSRKERSDENQFLGRYDRFDPVSSNIKVLVPDHSCNQLRAQLIQPYTVLSVLACPIISLA